MLYLIPPHLVKLFDLSDITGHLCVTGLDPPVKTRRCFVVGRSGPVDGKQEPLCQWRCHDDVQLPAVHQHLDAWRNLEQFSKERQILERLHADQRTL